jgi:hypothetical protein
MTRKSSGRYGTDVHHLVVYHHLASGHELHGTNFSEPAGGIVLAWSRTVWSRLARNLSPTTDISSMNIHQRHLHLAYQNNTKGTIQRWQHQCEDRAEACN